MNDDFITDEQLNELSSLLEHGRTPTKLELDRFIRNQGYALLDEDQNLPKCVRFWQAESIFEKELFYDEGKQLKYCPMLKANFRKIKE